ncbi:Uncharacterised protein [Chlamydia trachomatis]|nr:Uncharacterised protein [Chlamydia trachomatis]
MSTILAWAVKAQLQVTALGLLLFMNGSARVKFASKASIIRLTQYHLHLFLRQRTIDCKVHIFV